MFFQDQITVDSYRYTLPDSAIARFPLKDRDGSRLLFFDGQSVQHHLFRSLPGLLPDSSWLVFNNTKVIQARLDFRKSTGARIEIFCLEPVEPSDYQQSFASRSTCIWKCLVGNARKWKSGPVALVTEVGGREVRLEAWIESEQEESFRIRFDWSDGDCSFSEIIEQAGSTPIPPYLKREAEAGDKLRYQTVYSRDPGSVAAPTAGLHFTNDVLEDLAFKGIGTRELTLHVGAGTFVPIKHDDARAHAMHAETVLVKPEFLEFWSGAPSRPVAVGTTSTRSLETLYWLGAGIATGNEPEPGRIVFRQWDNERLPQEIPLEKSLEALLGYCRKHRLEHLQFSTGLMIVPGYRFRTISGLITNFHMPGSTLLLLIAALVGDEWKSIYNTALRKGYRFLSYGDSSLLLPSPAAGIR